MVKHVIDQLLIIEYLDEYDIPVEVQNSAARLGYKTGSKHERITKTYYKSD